jgi:hypothetical protein
MTFHYGKRAAMQRRSNAWPSANSSFSTFPEKPELAPSRILPAEMGLALSVPKPAELEVPKTASELEACRLSRLVETCRGKRAELEWIRKPRRI